VSRLTPPVSDADHRAGPDDAAVTLVEYGDFECPHCRRAHPIVLEVRKRMGQRLRFVFRHFPLSGPHPHAMHAAEAAEAAADQGKFWEMHDVIFDNQEALEDSDLIRYAQELGLDAERVGRELVSGAHEKLVREHFRSGVRSGVNGTPTFFINGLRYDGSWDSDTLLEALGSGR
jgi:protein-disulfide isomerase